MDPGKIKERLAKMDRTSHPDISQEEKNNKKDNKSNSIIQKKLAGKIKENEGGSFYFREVVYDLKRSHGSYCLGDLFDHDISELITLIGDNIDKNYNTVLDTCDLQSDNQIFKKFLFIDTETTGLMGGTGTLPFMIGTGFFRKDSFIVRQYFMRDYDDEYALLIELANLYKNYNHLVSFNGKTFDMPLLNTRFVMNRMEKPDIKFHFDLLHMARRIWNHLSSCSLGSLESNILDINRKDDIPGSKIPQIYFKYLRKKDPLLVAPIFKHNLIDIVSLVILLKHLLKVYNNTGECQLTAQELYNLGKCWEKRKEVEKSISMYEKAKAKADNYKLSGEIAKKLSWQYKRNNEWMKAISIWKMMISNNLGGLFPYIELAKYYEHKKKDYLKAKEYVNKGKNVLREKRILYDNYKDKKEKLEHRFQRLEKKILKKGVR